jgi:hypothetical protein
MTVLYGALNRAILPFNNFLKETFLLQLAGKLTHE